MEALGMSDTLIYQILLGLEAKILFADTFPLHKYRKLI